MKLKENHQAVKNKPKLLLPVLLLFCLFLYDCSGENESSAWSDKAFLTDVTVPLEIRNVRICGLDEAVIMGGKSFKGSFIFAEAGVDDPLPFVSFPLEETIKNVSFYIGSTHSEKSYYQLYETVYFYIDDKIVLEEKIQNSDVPSYYSFSVENAKSISFKTSGADIVLAVGALTAWQGEVELEETQEWDQNAVKLVEKIKPYYVSPDGSVSCVYSDENEICNLGGEEYTDALIFSIPSLKEWSNEMYAFFYPDGKFSHLSFTAGVIDNFENVEGGVANLSIFADGDLVFCKDMYAGEIEKIRVDIKNCKKLEILWKNYPSMPIMQFAMVGMYAEK